MSHTSSILRYQQMFIQSRRNQLIAKFTISKGDNSQQCVLCRGNYSKGNSSNYKRVEVWFVFDVVTGKLLQQAYGKSIDKIKNSLLNPTNGITIAFDQVPQPHLLNIA